MDAAFGKLRMDEQESDAWLLSIARVRSAADSGRRYSLDGLLAEAGLGGFGVNLDDLSYLDDETDII